MGRLYKIRDSPGKGRGVFASQAIAAGTVIIKEKPGLQLPRTKAVNYIDSITPAFVQHAFDQLPPKAQKQYLALHEGHRPYPSKVFRIYKANVFMIGGDTPAVYFHISHINHSCVRNAEMDQEGPFAKIIATRAIAEGEEIFICYNDHYHIMTKQVRGDVMRVYYDFECRCPGCTLPPREQELSDFRRQLLNVLKSAISGCQPVDMAPLEVLGRMTREQAEHKNVLQGLSLQRLAKPLTLEQETAYNLLIAGLLTAEGILGIDISRAYHNAATAMAYQICGDNVCMLLQSAELLRDWSTLAVEGTKELRGAASDEYLSVKRFDDDMKAEGGLVKIALMLLARGKGRGESAAIYTECVNGVMNVKTFSKSEYAAMLRNGVRTTISDQEYAAMRRQH